MADDKEGQLLIVVEQSFYFLYSLKGLDGLIFIAKKAEVGLLATASAFTIWINTSKINVSVYDGS